MPERDHRKRKTSFINNQTGTNSQSVLDRKSAYESMRDSGMLTPSLSGVSLYDKSPVIYDRETTSREILEADDPADVGGRQVDLSKTKVDGLTPFYSTYANTAINTGNVSYKARMFALSQGATEEEAQAVADQASNELKRLVSEARSSGDYSAMDQFFAGQNEFFQSILPQTLYEDTGAGGFTGSPTNYVGQDPITKTFFDIEDPTGNISSNKKFPSSGGPNYGGYRGYSSSGGRGGYPVGIPAIMYGDMQGENRYASLPMNQFMVDVHSPMYNNRGGIIDLLGDY